eukprot:Phypoly_transcript_13345.p1 GENE.Phypoly_transcript_13345~~Phypoly_transcript_13345.p1  ORF type:complete len:342 (+),score=36.57 Phypoly_transcript_13345:133-1026(+)
MAMGDSIIAAQAALDTNAAFPPNQYRGLSFPIGAEQGFNTLPNILQQYTAGPLKGVSTGIGPLGPANGYNGLNAAVQSTISSDMLGQAQWLVQQITTNTNVNMQQDWKILTIWIGSNNLCRVCSTDYLVPNINGGEAFENGVTLALDYLFANVPRLFVNLVANLNVSTIYDVQDGICPGLHIMACPCAGSLNPIQRAAVSTTTQDFIERAYKIANAFNARNSSTQAVVVQPCLIQTAITNRSMLSAADCFHPSAYTHSLGATALWNNMLSPASSKKTFLDPTDTPICATPDSLLYTN